MTTIFEDYVPPQPYYVYRLFDDAGSLLYVGCTYRPEKRVSQHLLTNPGIRERLSCWTLWRYPDRRAALNAEWRAIGEEQPELNVFRPGRRKQAA